MLLVAFASQPLAAQCPVSSAGTISEADPVYDDSPFAPDTSFCSGVLEVDCGGLAPGYLLEIQLSGRFGVDLTCVSTSGGLPESRLCAYSDACGDLAYTNPGGAHTIRIQGDLSTDLVTLAVLGEPLDCVYDSVIACEGDWGSSKVEEPTCHRLDLRKSGKGRNPVVTSGPSASCPAGQYLTGERIGVMASPASGWEMERWKGTVEDRSASPQNTVLMGSSAHTVIAVYRRAGFDSGFEKEGFGDWSDYFCPGCDMFTGTLAEGVSVRPQSGWYETERNQRHEARLARSDRVESLVELLRWAGSDWRVVASQSGFGPIEVSYEGPAGAFQWQVTSLEGGGDFVLAIDRAEAAPGNRLVQSDEAAFSGRLGMESTYAAGVKGPAYLIDKSPGVGGGETDYHASFRMRPVQGLDTRGKKAHEIFEGRMGRRKLFEIFLRHRGARGYGLYVRPRQGGKKAPLSGFLPIATDRWNEIEISWQSASGAGAEDGSLAVAIDGVEIWQVDLDNPNDELESVRLGQVSKGKAATAGVLQFDQFSSSWNEPQ